MDSSLLTVICLVGVVALLLPYVRKWQRSLVADE